MRGRDVAQVLPLHRGTTRAHVHALVTMWVVRSGDDLYVRSAYGRSNPWFQRALASGGGRIRAGGVERDVAFEEPGPALDEVLHRAYHAKYDRHGPAVVGTVVSAEAARCTLRLVRARMPGP